MTKSMHAECEVSIKVQLEVKIDNTQTAQKQYAPNHMIWGQ